MSRRDGGGERGRVRAETTLLAGRYRLHTLLGSGGHGEVWEAHDEVLGETVAVKILRCTEGEAARARREISTLRIVRLPGVVRLFDEGTNDDRPFIVMERVSGLPFPGRALEPQAEALLLASTSARTLSITASQTLAGTQSVVTNDPSTAALVTNAPQTNRRARWRWPALADRAEALLEVLARVHAAGVIHRDLKPDNVLVSDEGRLTVLDFGLSLAVARGEETSARGQILGTPAYLAPEQIQTGEIDERVDLYAVGVMLYEALAGRRPHESAPLTTLIVSRLFQQPPPIQEFAPDLPPTIAALIDRMLAIDPDDRPRSAFEALSVLRGQPAERRANPVIHRLSSYAPARATTDAALTSAVGPLENAVGREPISEEALRLLFDGPDRLFHMREDAARILFARTGGHPERVAVELDSWARAGLVRWGGLAFVIERDTLDRLDAGLEVAPAPRSRSSVLTAPATDELLHLLAAGERDLVATEAVALSRRWAEAGKLGLAATALQEALWAVRRWMPAAAHPGEELLLIQWVKLAFADRTELALDRALYEACRTGARDPSHSGVARLRRLLEAGLVVLSPRGRQALSMADALPPFEDPELERWRHWVRIRSASRVSTEVLLEALALAEEWALHSGWGTAKAILAGWLGTLRYNEGRFDEAAELHAKSAAAEPWLLDRIASALNSASALLEAFHHKAAAEAASAALSLAAGCRHAYLEGRATWIRRAAMYRMGIHPALDLELVDAISAVGVPELEALVCINEAAIAWRTNQVGRSTELAGRAGRIWKGNERPWPELLARCLESVSVALTELEVRALEERAIACPVPGIGIQALGLLKLAYPWLRPRPETVLNALCVGIPRAKWDQRMDVISVKEALTWASKSSSQA